MPITLTDHVDGDTMSWSDIATNIALVRAWLNDIPVTDIADESILREHLVRPRVFGFPGQAFEGFQRLFWQQHGVPISDAITPDEWGGRVERFIIRPASIPSQDLIWRLPVSRTVYFPRAVDVDVQCTFEAQSRSDPTAAPFYPDGASLVGGATAGFFALHIFNRQNGDDDYSIVGSQHVYPCENGSLTAITEHTDQFHVSLVTSLTAGTYDFYLAYHLGSDIADRLAQVTVSRVSVVGEAL